MKKIEKGCNALIIKSAVPSNIGLSVTVGEYLGKVPCFAGEDRWEIDGNIQSITNTGMMVDTANHANEDQLMRIDDFDESQEDHTSVVVNVVTNSPSEDDTLLEPS